MANSNISDSLPNMVWDQKLNEYENKKDIRNLVFVKCGSNSEAVVCFYKKNRKNKFEPKLACKAYIGKNGLGKEMEGDNKTPVGDFGIISIFGIKPNPGTSMAYFQINEKHYCCDENCGFYNKIIDTEAVNHQCMGEHLIDFAPQYNYCIFLDFNKESAWNKGSAIFVHCNGGKPYTAGCVALSEEDMIFLLKELDSTTRVCIYQK